MARVSASLPFDAEKEAELIGSRSVVFLPFPETSFADLARRRQPGQLRRWKTDPRKVRSTSFRSSPFFIR